MGSDPSRCKVECGGRVQGWVGDLGVGGVGWEGLPGVRVAGGRDAGCGCGLVEGWRGGGRMGITEAVILGKAAAQHTKLLNTIFCRKTTH